MSGFNVILGIKNSGFKKGLDESKKDAKRFQKEVNGGMAGIGGKLAGLVSAGAIGGFFKGIVEQADKIADISQRFGVGTQELQKLGRTAEENGSSFEAAAAALAKLAVSSDQALAGDEAMVASFRDLGVLVSDLQSLSPDQIMAKIGQGAMNASTMVDVLGKGALELAPALDALREARPLGIISDEDVQRMAKLKGDTEAIWHTLEGWGATLAGSVIQGVKTASNAIAAMWVGLQAMFKGEDFTEAAMKSFKDSQKLDFAVPSKAKAKPRDISQGSEKRDIEKRTNEVSRLVDRQGDAYKERERAEKDLKLDGLQARLDEHKRFAAMTPTERANTRRETIRKKHRDEAEERKFVRSFGKDRKGKYTAGETVLRELKDRADPAKQIQVAFEKVMQDTNGKIETLNETMEEIRDSLKFPAPG